MATSLEEFAERTGRYVNADYFVGRKVESCPDSLEPGIVWAIVFEGGGLIANYDPLMENPGRRIVGAALEQVVMTTRKTELRFGLEQVMLNPLEYAIRDENWTLGEMVFAQRSKYNMPVMNDSDE